jgi:hypothetical protein
MTPTERRTLALCAFAGGCILLGPRQWVSAIVCFALAAGLYALHRRALARERAPAPSQTSARPKRPSRPSPA